MKILATIAIGLVAFTEHASPAKIARGPGRGAVGQRLAHEVLAYVPYVP